MNIAFIQESLPIDEETYQEIESLSQYGMELDQCAYYAALNLSLLQKSYSRGFCILAYDEETDRLVGVITAVDKIGLNTYEWSMLVDPMYRKAGIDEALLSVLSKGFKERHAVGELVVLLENDMYGRKIIEKYGYTYSFSEATFEATAETRELHHLVNIRPFEESTDVESLIVIFREAFGDLREETIELLEMSKQIPGRITWVAELNGEVVGTVTTAKDGDGQWVTSLAVHPLHQRKGVATALLNWVKDYTYRNGDKRVLLEVEIENEEALSLYQKIGFKKALQIDFYVYEG